MPPSVDRPDEPGATTGARPVRMPTPDGWLGERYQLEEPIASGGAATVWRAFDATLARSVAVKLLHPHLASDAVTVERFRLESVNAARIAHPNAVAIYDTNFDGDLVYLVMEYVDGPSLKDVLAERGALDPEVVAALGEQVATALGEAHAAGVVHRDIKPGNILLTQDGVAKVTDFGIAKALSDAQDTLTGPGTVVGTAAYVAPEQLEGAEADPRIDVFALGVVLYECLLGSPAFTGDTPTATAAARLTRELRPPRQLRADIPRGLDDIVVRATRRDPRARFRDGTAMAAALAPLVRSRPAALTRTLLGPASTPRRAPAEGVDPQALTAEISRTQTPMQLSRGWWIGIGIAAVIAIAGVVLLNTMSDDPVSPEPVGDGVVPIQDARDFDPFGQPQEEHREEVPLAFDGDAGTAWTTENYRTSPQFGGLKVGVGVWFDLGSPQPLDQIVLDLTAAGVSFDVYRAATLPDQVDGLVGWGQPVTSVNDADNPATVQLDGRPEGRFWLVWLTSLPPADGGLYQAGIREIRFVGGTP